MAENLKNNKGGANELLFCYEFFKIIFLKIPTFIVRRSRILREFQWELQLIRNVGRWLTSAINFKGFKVLGFVVTSCFLLMTPHFIFVLFYLNFIIKLTKVGM